MNNMIKYTVKKGQHDFKPVDSINIIAPWRRSVKFRVRFEKDCNYLIPGEDQYDWNKGGGFAFLFGGILTNTYHSCMWGWRYNPKIDKMELSAYWHDKGTTHYAELDNFEPFIVPFETDVDIEIYKPGVKWRVAFSLPDGVKNITETGMTGWPVRPIGLNVGGNVAATQDMTVYMSRN